MGCRKESFFLEFMNVDVARDFVGVVFYVLLDGAKSSHNHRDCCCFAPPHLLNFQVVLSFSVVLAEVLVSRRIVMSMSRQVLSSLFFSTISWDGPVSVNEYVPQNGDAVPGDSLGFMLIPSFLHLNTKVTLCRSSSACVQLVVAVDVFSFNQFRAARDPMVNGLVETAPKPAFWVYVSLLEDVVLVLAYWEALILGCDDKALGFSLEAVLNQLFAEGTKSLEKPQENCEIFAT